MNSGGSLSVSTPTASMTLKWILLFTVRLTVPDK